MWHWRWQCPSFSFDIKLSFEYFCSSLFEQIFPCWWFDFESNCFEYFERPFRSLYSLLWSTLVLIWSIILVKCKKGQMGQIGCHWFSSCPPWPQSTLSGLLGLDEWWRSFKKLMHKKSISKLRTLMLLIIIQSLYTVFKNHSESLICDFLGVFKHCFAWIEHFYFEQ